MLWHFVQEVFIYAYSVSYMLSHRNFNIWSIISRSLINFDLILEQNEERDLLLIFHVDLQFTLHHLLGRLAFLQHVFLASLFKKNHIAMGAWVCF